MRVALIVNPVTVDRESNLSAAIRMIREAAGNGSDLVLLGEMAVTGMINRDDPARDFAWSENVPGPLTDHLSETAGRLGIWLGFGLLERAGGRLYDTALLLSPDGDIRLKYRRIQPQWHGKNADPAIYCQGTELLGSETDFGTMAFMICGDLWDDALRRQMRDMRPDFVLHLFARCFADKSRDQVRWEKNELPEYKRRVAEIGAPLLATSYVYTEAFPEEADAFGGAMAIDRDGAIMAAYPLNQSGILYFNSETFRRKSGESTFVCSTAIRAAPLKRI